MHGSHVTNVLAQGWQWVNEGKSPVRPKWGFVSETEGESLTVQVRAKFLLISGQGRHLHESFVGMLPHDTLSKHEDTIST